MKKMKICTNSLGRSGVSFFNNFIISPHLCISTSLLQEQKQAKAYNIAPEFKRIVEWRYQLLVRKKEIKIETQYNINK